MKKIIITLALVAGFIGITHAATVIGVPAAGTAAIINSASTTATNLNFGGNTNGIWPCTIPGGTLFTNVTRVDVSAGNTTTVQFSINTTGNAAVATNIIWQLGRNVSGDSPTNSQATNAKIEWFTTCTNTVAASGSASTACYTFSVPLTGSGNGLGDAACTAFYIGNVTTPTGITMTNYTVYVSTR